ncbi:MAG: hypothetical protein J0L75_05280 [Spirochaetes bacterium]|nr:hypothetical protein [Spirochaetota bacterium]
MTPQGREGTAGGPWPRLLDWAKRLPHGARLAARETLRAPRGALEGLFFLFIFFPYIRILPIPTDLQPNALLMSGGFLIYFLVVQRRPMPLPLLPLLFCALYSVVILFAFPITFDALRSLANYLGVFSMTLAVYFVLQGGFGRMKAWLAPGILLWGAIGVIQKFVSPTIVTALVLRGNINGYGGRGVESFSPEPTFFGLVILFYLLLLFIERDRRLWLYAALLFELVFLTKSTMAIFILLLLGFLGLLLRVRRPRDLAVPTILALSLPILFRPGFLFPPGSRILRVIDYASTGPAGLLRTDTSLNERFSHVLFSLYGFLRDFPMPNGYGTFGEFFSAGLAAFPDLINTQARFNRIMSGYGGAVFELGLPGLVIPATVTWIIFRADALSVRERLMVFFALSAILMMSVPLSLPFVGLILGVLLHKRGAAPPATATA